MFFIYMLLGKSVFECAYSVNIKIQSLFVYLIYFIIKAAIKLLKV